MCINTMMIEAVGGAGSPPAGRTPTYPLGLPDDAVAAGALGRVEALVGNLRERVHVARGPRGRHADAGREHDARGDAIPELVADRREQPLAAGDRRLGARLGHQQHELLATRADQDVLGPQLAEQQAAGPHQHLVADLVTEAVVDGLEVIEVEHGEAERLRPGGRGVAVELARGIAGGGWPPPAPPGGPASPAPPPPPPPPP